MSGHPSGQVACVATGLSEMSGLKDICLQVRYEGGAAKLLSEFYAPLTAETVMFRMLTTSLLRESLVHAGLGVRHLLTSGKPVRLMVVVPTTNDRRSCPSGGCR